MIRIKTTGARVRSQRSPRESRARRLRLGRLRQRRAVAEAAGTAGAAGAAVAESSPVLCVADAQEPVSARVIENRIDVINLLIEKRGYRRYLEIGCWEDNAFANIIAAEKVGVDPVEGGTVRQSSDEFFERAIADGEKFDVIFIDGDHHHDQVFRDVENSLLCLTNGGAVLMHDCLPPDRIYETKSPTRDVYYGTAWRAFVQFRTRPDLDAIVGDFDCGLALIRKVANAQPLVLDKTMDELTYDDFVAHRQEWMRPVDPIVFQILADRHWGPISIALLVIGKSDEEIQWFREHSPHVEEEARVVLVANPGMKYGGTAAIANPFLETATEDVVGIVHADTTFAAGALEVFAREAIERRCVTGIVGRRAPDPEDRFSGYTWCTDGGGFVSTLDSCSIFFQRKHGLRFDGATFDSFHCVVEDICLQAHRMNMRAFVPAVKAGHVGNGGAGAWNDQFWAYRAKLVAKYPDIIFHTI
jgi:hypothetical protein